MSYAGINNSEFDAFYNKFTKGFRVGDKVKSPIYNNTKIIGDFCIDGPNGSTIDEFLSISTREDINYYSTNSTVYVKDDTGVSLGIVDGLELVDDGLFSFADYEKDKEQIQKYPEVDEFLKKHNLTIEQKYIPNIDKYKPCIVFNGEFKDIDQEESIKKILKSLLGYDSLKITGSLSSVTGTVSNPNYINHWTPPTIPPTTGTGTSNPINYLELLDKIQKEARNNLRIQSNSNIMLIDTKTKTWKQCENCKTLIDLYTTYNGIAPIGTPSIVRVSLNGKELDFNGIKLGHNIIDVLSLANGTIHIKF